MRWFFVLVGLFACTRAYAQDVEAGQRVEPGVPLMILEAMKMEHTIAAPAAGKVAAINYRSGEQVAEGADLIDIEAA